MADKTSILYLDNTSTFGGAINSLLYLLRAIDKNLFTPILVTAQSEDFLSEKFNFIEWYNVEIKLSWVHNKTYKRIIRNKFLATGLGLKVVNKFRFVYWLLFVTLPEAVKYYRIGRKHNVSCVHLNDIIGSQLAGIIAAKLLSVPCVAHLRDFEEVDTVTKCYASMVDAHIAISGAIKDNLLQLGVPEEKIFLIHDAIDLDDFNTEVSCDYLRKEFKINEDDKKIGIFGRIIDWKGIKEFVHGVARVVETIPRVKAFIVGDCSDGDTGYLAEVKDLIAHYGLDQNVILTGYRKDVASLMGLMDVVVHTSITPEPFGMVLIEGMAMAKPVVSTRFGGPLDIVEEGKTGFLVDPLDACELASAIERLLLDRELAMFMGQNGQDRVSAVFAKERYAFQVEEVYAHVLKK